MYYDYSIISIQSNVQTSINLPSIAFQSDKNSMHQTIENKLEASKNRLEEIEKKVKKVKKKVKKNVEKKKTGVNRRKRTQKIDNPKEFKLFLAYFPPNFGMTMQP